MIDEVTNHSGAIISTLASAYVSLNFYLIRMLFKRTQLTKKFIDERIDEKLNAKTAVLETKIDSIDMNVKSIMDAIFKDVHLVNKNKTN